MGTVEIIIVFSALMALIALVTIGIDWIGKPLKNRRFIPRIYRFDDEKLPVDAYGNTTLSAAGGTQTARPAPHVQPAPVVVARVPEPAHDPHATVQAPAARIAARQPQTRPIPSAVQAAGTATSAFSDTLSEPEATVVPALGLDGAADWLAPPADDNPSRHLQSPAGRVWNPDMPLDATIDDRKPNLATKAERFWMATAAALDRSHFDIDDVDRMSGGKAPRRTNPRTGRTEAMQLTGLRQASLRADVRMRWPDDSVDPWSAT